MLERALVALDALEAREAAEAARSLESVYRTRVISNAVFMGLDAILFVLVLGAARVVRQEIRVREAHEAELARTQEMQQRLVAVVSHDLRNPLSGILTAAWALARTDLPDDAIRAARRIAAAGRRMERLIRDLLDWSRAKAGAEIPVHLREGDLYDLCARVADDLSDPRCHRIELVREGDTVAEFDPDRMEQVVANLLSNALKYGDPERPVRIGAVGEEGAVRVEVSDDGPGLDRRSGGHLRAVPARAPRPPRLGDERRARALRRADAQRGAGCAGERRVRAGAGDDVRRPGPPRGAGRGASGLKKNGERSLHRSSSAPPVGASG